MGVFKYNITVESDTPLRLMLGEDIGGAVVKELREIDVGLVTAAHLAKKYKFSVPTIREKLASINQGSEGKFLYDPKAAHTLLTKKTTKGRPRAN